MEKPKIIAEIGLSHEGSLGNAKNAIYESVCSGADVVKFQIHFAEFESSQNEQFRINFSEQDLSRWDYWKRTSFNNDQWQILKDYTHSLGAKFCASVFSFKAIEVMSDIKAEIVKVGSGDSQNQEIAELLENFSGEIIVSTGMSSWADIQNITKLYSKSFKNRKLTILQCTSLYPTPLNKLGVNVIKEIKDKLGLKSGLSDHSVGINGSIIAMALGADYIEKHVVFSKKMFGPDSSSSITFEELKVLSNFRNELMEILVQVDKDLEVKNYDSLRKIFGRSLGLKTSMSIGHTITADDFCLRKPSGGFTWSDRKSFIGKTLVRQYSAHEFLSPKHFELD
jgi:N,N'-diacetyllegionaminate synthase